MKTSGAWARFAAAVHTSGVKTQSRLGGGRVEALSGAFSAEMPKRPPDKIPRILPRRCGEREKALAGDESGVQLITCVMFAVVLYDVFFDKLPHTGC
jgi:hypothetical protein